METSSDFTDEGRELVLCKKKKENESDETDAGSDDDKVSELLPNERQL